MEIGIIFKWKNRDRDRNRDRRKSRSSCFTGQTKTMNFHLI